MNGKVARAIAVPLILAIAVVAVEGCSVFTNLDVNGYTAADAGKPDANLCPAGFSCVIECISPADCQQGDLCCLTISLTSYGTKCCAGGQLRTPDDGGGDGADE